ncbi:60 kDa chaperonin [Striga asiatica]|uniref:60 kDa chaperonin n=1 Tax=Striga asiatica TaxID=4170 RepID=A0A5A7P4Z4_STRAF|nr:60 kDa chaperonin [Striga asiatica]
MEPGWVPLFITSTRERRPWLKGPSIWLTLAQTRGPLVGDATQWAQTGKEELAEAHAVESDQLAGVVVEEECGKLGGVVVEAGRVHGREQIVVDVVVAPKHEHRYGMGQVPCLHHRPQLTQRSLEIDHLLTERVAFIKDAGSCRSIVNSSEDSASPCAGVCKRRWRSNTQPRS